MKLVYHYSYEVKTDEFRRIRNFHEGVAESSPGIAFGDASQTQRREASKETAVETGFFPRFSRQGLGRRRSHLAGHFGESEPLPRDLR
jgi:hypothetical protein